MISSFSGAGYLIRCRPHSLARFFEQAVHQHDFGQRFLELSGLDSEILDVVRRRLSDEFQFLRDWQGHVKTARDAV